MTAFAIWLAIGILVSLCTGNLAHVGAYDQEQR